MGASAAELRIDVARIDRAVAAAETFPARFYDDQAIHDFEMTEIWNKRWQIAGARSELKQPGDYFLARAGRVPAIIALDADGGLRGFVNVCPHRGFPVAGEGGDSADGWMCMYHGWRFGLDGALKEAPGTLDEAGFDRGACGLRPVAIDTWGEAILVNADPTAVPFRKAHPSFVDFTENQLGLDPDFGRYEPFDTRVYDVATNWKMLGENFLECYHCPTVHPNSLQSGFDDSAGKWEYLQVEELFSSRFVPDEGSDGLQFYGALQAVPGLLVIQHDDFAMLGQTVPTGPESSRFTVRFYREPDSSAKVVEDWVRVWHNTFLEDFELIEIQQRTVCDAGFDDGSYIRASEELIVRFQEIVWGLYKEAFGGATPRDPVGGTRRVESTRAPSVH
jgi:phenylpropionate dioxygenase-like ring-hydroxylating dioxygenase large terminal subunit